MYYTHESYYEVSITIRPYTHFSIRGFCMKSKIFGIILSILMLSATSTAYCNYEVGISIDDITPSTEEIASGQIYLGAYGVGGWRGHATGIHDSIYARSIVIQSGGITFALSVLDLPGMGTKTTERIKNAVVERIKIHRENIFITNTHTHSAPDFQGLWGGVPEKYRNFVIHKTSDSIIRAYQSKQEAIIKVSTGSGNSTNRRTGGKTDIAMTIMEFVEASTSSKIGVFVNFAAHPTILDRHNRMISRDWPGYLVDRLESRAEAPIIFTNGIFGDVSATGKGRTFDRAKSYGEAMAEVADKAMKGSVPISGEMEVITKQLTIPLENMLFRFVCALKEIDYNCDGGFLTGYHFDTELSYISIGGELEIALLPGEPFTSSGLIIKDAMTAPYKMIIGQTNGSMGYLIPTGEYNHWYNTDELVCLNPDFGDTIQNILIKTIRENN
jgi:neutral/alkaline ceramidase-like enzyme